MQNLAPGLHRIRPEDFRSSNRLLGQATRGQRLGVLLITCCDLGIDPCSLVPTRPEGLYVLQGLGNIVPAYDPQRFDAPSQVERALTLYPLTDIVVLGHSPCVAMRHLLSLDEERELRSVVAWLAHATKTRRIVEEHYRRLEGEPLLIAAAAENVVVQLENLRTSPAVALGLDRGELHLHGWVYNDGVISAYAPARRAFLPLAQ